MRLLQINLNAVPAFAEHLQLLHTAITRKHSFVDWVIRLITAVAPLTFLAVIVLQPWVDAKWMFLDPLTAAELSGDCCHSHFGFVSTSGVILWAATAAVSLFAAALLFIQGRKMSEIKFPLMAGLLTGWLALDDAFLLHETVLPAFGVPQNAILAFYVSLAAAYFTINLRAILTYDFWLLAMGAAALALSMGVDTIFHSLNPLLVLLEDSAKFFGIFCWMAFHVTTFAKLLSSEHLHAGKNRS